MDAYGQTAGAPVHARTSKTIVTVTDVARAWTSTTEA